MEIKIYKWPNCLSYCLLPRSQDTSAWAESKLDWGSCASVEQVENAVSQLTMKREVGPAVPGGLATPSHILIWDYKHNA